jgi:hypothetical protein
MNNLIKISFKVTIVYLTLTYLVTLKVAAQDPSANYDESKVPAYTLPDALQMASGKRVTSAKQWMDIQRPAMLKLFKDNEYGQYPGKPKNMHFKLASIDSFAVNGKAIRKEITMFFTANENGPSMNVLIYIPKESRKPVPVFTGLNYYGNQTVSTEKGIILSNRWMRENKDQNIVEHRATELSRGKSASSWPIEEIIKRGYGLATAYYGDVEPDHAEGWKTGIRTTMEKELNIKADEWGAIGAWGWSLSRMLDYLETEPSVNAKQVVITGHSRLGKAALWAAANDTRFSIIVSNESGEGGAALARRWYGETVERINKQFPHWFNSKFKEYNNNVDKLPFDQHILLALMAPRPLYVASAEGDQWSDPKGEFLGLKNAEPVYALFGKKGLGVKEMPPVNHPVGETLGYHNRTGKHAITLYDWQQYLDFADKHFKRS